MKQSTIITGVYVTQYTFVHGHTLFTAIFLPTADVIIGFEQTQFTVLEDVGQVELCLHVTAPVSSLIPLIEIDGVGVETVEGTAGTLLSCTAVSQTITCTHIFSHRQ